MDSIPVLIKSGGILPLSKDKGNGCKNPKNLEIWSYKGNGNYSLYEDGKEEDNEGIFRTRFTSAYQKCGKKSEQRLWITSEGDDCVYPKGRTLSIRFKDIAEGEVTLYIDGEESGVEEWITDCAAIRFPFESGKKYEIVVSFQEPTVLEKAKLRAQKELVLAEGGNRQKYGVFKKLLKAENLEQFIRIAEESPLSETVKARIKETL